MRRITAQQADDMVTPFALDLHAAFVTIREDVLERLRVDDKTPEAILKDIEGMFDEQNPS